MNLSGLQMAGLGVALAVGWTLSGVVTLRLVVAWDRSTALGDEDLLGVGLAVVFWPILLGFVVLMIVLTRLGRLVVRIGRR